MKASLASLAAPLLIFLAGAGVGYFTHAAFVRREFGRIDDAVRVVIAERLKMDALSRDNAAACPALLNPRRLISP